MYLKAIVEVLFNDLGIRISGIFQREFEIRSVLLPENKGKCREHKLLAFHSLL